MIVNWTIFIAHNISLINRMTFGCTIITFMPTLFFITLPFPSLLISFWPLRIFRWRFIIFSFGVIFSLRIFIFFFCLVPINDPYPLRVARTTAFRLWNFTKVSRQITPQKLLSGQFIILRLLNDPLRNAVWTP